MHKGSELAELLVAAGVIADGTVDHALRGKHYRGAIRCLMLTYEELTYRLVRRHITGAGFDPTKMARLSVLRDIHVKYRASLARAYQNLQKDPDIDTFSTNMFLGAEECGMAKYWLDSLAMVWCLLHID